MDVNISALISRHIADLGKLIERESDPHKRSELMLLLSMMNEQKDIAEYMASMRIDHNRRITDAEEKIKGYDNLILQMKTILKVISTLWFAVSGSLIGVVIYGYTLVADLRDTVLEQSVILPRLEQVISNSRQQAVALPRIEKRIEGIENTVSEKGNLTDQEVQDKINSLNDEIEKMKKLRVIKRSR